MKVLFTGGGGAGAEALWQLYAQRYEVHFADADINTIDPIVCPGQRHQIPMASDDMFFEEVHELCKKLEIDVLVPSVDEELLILAHGIDKILPTKLMLPDYEFVDVMLDKLSMIMKLAKKNIPIPLTFSLDDDFSGISFPCISKPRKGRGSRDVVVLNAREEAQALKMTLGPSANDFIVQNKIEGQEYTVQMAANSNGVLSAVVPVKVAVKRGITIVAEVEAEPKVIEACKIIHAACPTKGCYNIQLILTEDGKVMPFEINPRVSTTYCLVVAADVDPIEIFLEKDNLGELAPFSSGMQLRRHWQNHFSKG